MEGQRRRQGGEQPAATHDGRSQRHGPAGRIHRAHHKRRPRGRDGRERQPGEHHDRQSAKHGHRHGIRAGEPEPAGRSHQLEGN